MQRTLLASCAAAVLLLSGQVTGQYRPEAPAERVIVTLDPACVRSIGGVSRFRREQFITIHASPTERELSEEDRDFLQNELEVSFGRDGGSRSWHRSQTPADPKRPDFPDAEHIRERGADGRVSGRQQREIRWDVSRPRYSRPRATGKGWWR